MIVVSRVWCGDHEEQAGWFAIHGFEVHPGRYRHSGESGRFHTSTLGMRCCNAVAESGRTGCFAGEDVFFVLFFIGQVAASCHEVSQLIDCGGFVSRSRAQNDAVALEQISDTHIFSPLYNNEDLR